MKDHVTVFAKPGSADTARLGSRFARLDSATHRAANRSLSQLAFVYASAYFVGFFYYWYLTVQRQGAFGPPRTQDVVLTVVSMAYSLWVALRCRSGSCGPGAFAATAQNFLIMGGLGISGNLWAWEQLFVPISSELIGVSWLGVWLVVFPNLVTLTPRRFLAGALVNVIALLAIIYGSALLHGVPPALGLSAMELSNRLVGVMLVPVLICVGIAGYCAHRSFRMVEEVSEARRMGSYQLTERIGAGGMGEVWKAEHQMLARPAAIKLIRRDALGSQSDSAYRTLVSRFEREVQATAALTSPNTIQIYDFGVTDGSFYYVMELLEGMDLKSLVEKFGPVPAARAASFLRQACDSLFDAHQSGMIHRDVKPANLFTCRRGQTYDFVKVLDFGLVKDTAAREENKVDLTMQGVISGTPAFMAPEMATGAHAIDGRADCYALGCVGYWLLTGEFVFPADSPLAMLLQHAKDSPVPPSARSELAIPPSLDRLILQCLEKRPEDRPRSARELASQLAEIERECEPWTPQRAERWWRTHLPHLIGAEVAAV